jgi:hypothetical protein
MVTTNLHVFLSMVVDDEGATKDRLTWQAWLLCYNQKDERRVPLSKAMGVSSFLVIL